jgi:hypothetical protein
MSLSLVTNTQDIQMFTNSNRSGFIRAKPNKDSRAKPQSEIRSGHSASAADEQDARDIQLPRKKIVEINGKLKLVDA